jgi:hypothetical protein
MAVIDRPLSVNPVLTSAPRRALPLTPLLPLAEELWWIVRFAALLLWLTLRFGYRQARRIPGAVLPPLGAVALCGYMAVRAVSGYLADPRPLVAVFLAPVVVVVGFALFCAWTCSGLAPVTYRGPHGSMTVRRTITGKTELTARYVKTKPKPKPKKFCTPKSTAVHEGGHAAAIEACGGTIVGAAAFSDGSGWCKGRLPRMGTLRHRVINYMSVMVAGEVATGSKSGCGHDQYWATWAAEKLPKKDRSMAWSRCYSMARWAQSTHRATAARVRDALLRTGRYHGAGGSQHYL